MKNSHRLIPRLLCVLSLLVLLSASALAADPGSPTPFQSVAPIISDQGRGFMLIYNIYTSSSSNPSAQNTRINITNTSDRQPISVHLFFVEGSTCGISDRYICLTPNQTATFLASEQDPGTTGYIVALATTSSGIPAEFAFLMGDAYVKFDNGFFGNLGAEAIPTRNIGFFFPDNNFDHLVGLTIGEVPRVLAVDYIGSRQDGNETLLVANAIGGNYGTGANTIGTLFGLLYNDQEEPHSWNRPGNGCQLLTQLNDSFPRTTPRFGNVIPAGQSGWMKFWSTSVINNAPFGNSDDARALLGAVFQRNPNAGSSSGGFQGARNLHKLSLLATYDNDGQDDLVEGFTSKANQARVNGISNVRFQDVALFIFPVFPNTCGFLEK